MVLSDLKKIVDRYVAEGHGDAPVICTPENYMPGYRSQAFSAGLRAAKIQGQGYWVYNLRDDPQIQVFEVGYAPVFPQTPERI